MKFPILMLLASTRSFPIIYAYAYAPFSHRQQQNFFRTTSTRTFLQPSNSPLKEDRSSDLGASTDSSSITYGDSDDSSQRTTPIVPGAPLLDDFVFPVLSAAMLITGNTVGASMLVLPDLAQGPGLAISGGVLLMAYLMNWLSGLCIASVAIQQYEQSGDEVPSSFKEFAQANLFEAAAAIVSGISIFVNSLVLAFDTTKAGQVLQSVIGSTDLNAIPNQTTTIALWAVAVLGIVSTQSLERLSQIASLMVIGVFVSFAGILLPGLARVSDPWAVLSSGPSSPDVDLSSSVLHMAPVFVTTLVYQNIVPTVTRILGYDKTKVSSAITLGSFLPLCIYVAWCVAVLGGGVESSSGNLFTLFSIVTVAGSSIGALMSLSEEFEIILGQEKKDSFSLPSVAIPSLIALGVCQLFADDISRALKVAGSYGSPLLYGIIPVSMAYLQRQRRESVPPTLAYLPSPSTMPGGMAGLGLLGAGAVALVGSEVAMTLGQVVSSLR